MLNIMRENLRHLKWVLWIVAASMVLYLGVYFRSCGKQASSEWAAMVDGRPIPTRQFLEAARRMDAFYRHYYGKQYEQMKSQLQLGTQAIRELVDEQIVLAEASRLGLEATAEDVARAIRQNRQFQGADGKFVGSKTYKTLVSRGVPGGVEAYERDLAHRITMGKWQHLLAQAVVVDDAEIEEAYRARNEKTSLEYVMVAAAAQKVDTQVTPEQRQAWYQTHREEYRRGEARRIRYVVTQRASVMDSVQVTDQDITDFYNQNQTTFTRPEQRHVRHILFRVPPDADPKTKEAARTKAEEALARLKKGADFAELAARLSDDELSAKKGGDLGFFGRGSMIPAFENAVWQLAPNEFAPVVETPLGFHVIQLLAVKKGGVAPLQEVREAIARQLRLRRAQDRIAAEAESIRSRLAAGETMESVAAELGLKVQKRVVTHKSGLNDLGPSPGFLDSVFALPAGGVSEPLGVAAGLAVVQVQEALPPAVPSLDEVAGKVTADILNDRAHRSAMEQAQRAFRKAGSFQGAARLLGLKPRKVADVTRGQALPGVGGFTPEMEKAFFGDGVEAGAGGVVRAPAGTMIYRITHRTAFDNKMFRAAAPGLRRELLERRQAEILDAAMQALRQQHEVKINQQVVSQLNG